MAIPTDRAYLLKPRRFPALSDAVKAFGIPAILCFMLFVASPFFLPQKTMRMVDAVKFLLLAHAAFAFLYNKGPLPKLGLMGWMLIIGLLMDFLSDTSVVKLSPITLIKLMMPGTYRGWDSLQNVGVVLLVAIYITSYMRLTAFVRVLIIAVTITVALVGLYQYQTGQLLADFSRIEQFRILSSSQVGRLSGLVYGCANEACVPMVLCAGLLIGRVLVAVNTIDILVLATNLLAIVLSFTRGAYIACGIMIFVGILIKQRLHRQGKTKQVIILCFCCAVVVYFAYGLGLPRILESGDIKRFMSSENVQARLSLYIETMRLIPEYWLFGRGLTGDIQVWHPFRFFYVTPHSFIFDWIIRFGCVATSIFLLLVGLQLVRLVKVNLGRGISEGSLDPLSLGLLLAYVGVLFSCLVTGDRYYFIPLLYSLCATYFRSMKRH